MSELEDRLGAILRDPDQMNKIAQMASKLMGGLSPPAEEAPPPEPAGFDLGGLDAGLLKTIGKVVGGLGGAGGADGKRQLVAGMAPWLDADRRRRLERALKVAAAAKLAGAAFSQLGGGDD